MQTPSARSFAPSAEPSRLSLSHHPTAPPPAAEASASLAGGEADGEGHDGGGEAEEDGPLGPGSGRSSVRSSLAMAQLDEVMEQQRRRRAELGSYLTTLQVRPRGGGGGGRGSSWVGTRVLRRAVPRCACVQADVGEDPQRVTTAQVIITETMCH